MLRTLLLAAIAAGAAKLNLTENGSTAPVRYTLSRNNTVAQNVTGHAQAFAELGFTLPIAPGTGCGFVVLDGHRIEYQASTILHSTKGTYAGWDVVFFLTPAPYPAERYRGDIII